MSVPMLVISGPPGVGKTTLAWQLFSRCTSAGLDPAMVDLDLLGAAWPAPADDPHQSRLKAQNLAAVWANFQANGSRRLIVAAVVETESEKQMLRAAVGGDLLLCRLKASAGTLADRIRGRGRDVGDDMDKLTRRAAELSIQLAERDVGDLVLDTDLQTPDEVADVALTAWLSRDAATHRKPRRVGGDSPARDA